MTRLTSSPDFDPRIADWLETDPDDAPDLVLETVLAAFPSIPQRRAARVPWRLLPMNRTALLGAAAAVVVLIGAALLVLRPGSATVAGPSVAPPTVPALASIGPSALPAASTTPASAAVGDVGPLDRTFISPRNDFEVGYPHDWTVSMATADWLRGRRTLWGDPALDALTGKTARFVAAAQPLAPGQTAAEWFTAYCQLGGSAPDCTNPMGTWRKVQIGTTLGYVDLDGVKAASEGIVAGGVIFDAVAVAGGRGYELTLDGDVNRSSFDRMLVTVRLTPNAGDVVSHLTSTFTSPLYHYRIRVDPSWTTDAATVRIGDSTSTDAKDVDTVKVTGTDTTIEISATSMNGLSYDAWAVRRHQDAIPNVPPGCDGGDPSTWPTIPVGSAVGRLMQLCNAGEVSVAVGPDAYVFFWGNDTFNGTKHLDEAQFFRVLQSVEFTGPGASAAPSAAP